MTDTEHSTISGSNEEDNDADDCLLVVPTHLFIPSMIILYRCVAPQGVMAW